MKMKNPRATKRTKNSRHIDLAAYKRDPEEKQIQEKLVSELHLDPKNPRLAEVMHTGTQASIQKVMEKEFDLQQHSISLQQYNLIYLCQL